jgi:peptide subunit release factor 1 (eRF1)
MEIIKELQQLAKFSHPILPVISVYVRTPAFDQDQGAKSIAFLNRHLRQARALTLVSDTARQSFARDLSRLEQWAATGLNGPPQGSAFSVALFACSGAGVWVEFPSPIRLDNEFTIMDRPALRQLARLDADYTNALVVLMDAQSARICEVVLGGLRSEAYFSREDSDLPSLGGQLRYRRQIQDDAYHHYEEVAEYVTAYCTERPETYLILSAKEPILTRFRQLLPLHMQGKIIDTAALDWRTAHDRILRIARGVLEQHELQEDRETVQLLIESAARGGLAVLGLADTLLAVNTGLIHKLVMHRDFQRFGWRCQDCHYIGTGEEMASQCTICNGPALAVELGDAMVTEVLRNDGFFEPIAREPRLVGHDGIGALLRHL